MISYETFSIPMSNLFHLESQNFLNDIPLITVDVGFFFEIFIVDRRQMSSFKNFFFSFETVFVQLKKK